jgi:DNA (cytosine-5)-methyltransferase 1
VAHTFLVDKRHKRSLRVAGLFAGVGGFELGLERAGHRTVLLCESSDPAREVLKKHFKKAKLRHDVRKLKYLPREVDLVTAGFPCQDLSQAGTTAGLGGQQSKVVWEAFRLIHQRKPEFVLFENVPFMLRLNCGKEIGRIITRLERLGYKWAYRVIDAQCFGVPQRRPRVFILGSRVEDPRNVLLADNVKRPRRPKRGNVYGFYWTEGNTGIGLAVNAIPALKNGSAFGIPSPPAISLADGRIVTPHICDAERLQGFPPHWTANGSESKHRWRLVGNAVNVRVSTWIGRRLRSPGQYEASKDKNLSSQNWPTAAYNVGAGRFQAQVTEFPISRAQLRLPNFLQFPPRPLSSRATEGILARLMDSSLTAKSVLVERLWSHLVALD